MSVAMDLRPLVMFAASVDEPTQDRIVANLAMIGPEALVATYIAARDLLESRRLDGLGDLGFLDKIGKFFSKVGDGVKQVVSKAAPVAAPFLNLIPGIGPGLSQLAMAAPGFVTGNLDVASMLFQQQQAQSAMNAFGSMFASGMVNPQQLASAATAEIRTQLEQVQAKLKESERNNAIQRQQVVRLVGERDSLKAAQASLAASNNAVGDLIKNPAVLIGGAALLFMLARR